MTDTERDPTPITGSWRGHPQFCCRLCDFDTLEEAKFIDHFAKVHPPLEIFDGGKEDPAQVTERMTREELEAKATALGIVDVSKDAFANKPALIEAILATDQEGA